MVVYVKFKIIWGICYYVFLVVNFKYKFGLFLDIISILVIIYDVWLILLSLNSLLDICK